MEEVQNCKNCKKDISSKNFVIHSLHCEKNLQLCDRCLEPIPRNEFENHEKEFHSQETCSDCHVSIEKWQIEKHTETCKKKLVPCEYCQLEIRLDNIFEHVTVCGSRTEQCPRCKKHVMLKDLDEHPINCLKKESEAMPCEYCGQPFNSHEIIAHTIMCGTQTERCFQCNQHVMVQDKVIHLATCEKKPQQLSLNFPCKYCGNFFPCELLEEHADICGSHADKCENCDKYIKLKNKETHSFICLKNSADLKNGIPCKFCDNLFPHNQLEHHASICGTQTYKCENCEKFVRFDEKEKHQCVKTMSKIHGECPVCGALISWVEMNVHAAMCSQIHYDANNYELQNKFNEHALRKESEASKNKTSEEKKIQNYEKSKECPFCLEFFPQHNFLKHLENCSRRPYNCETCLKAMPFSKKDEHLHYCRSQKPEKSYANAYKLHDEEMDDNRGLKKLKKCQFCNERFTDVLFKHHMEKCEHREEKCIVCEENVRYKDMHEHRSNKCFSRHSENRSIYGRVSTLSEAVPEPSSNLDSKRYLEEDVSLCPFCNSKIPETKYHKHLQLCIEEKTECHFCSLKIKKNQMHEHIKNCWKVSEMVKEENSQGKKKKEEKNEGKSWLSNKVSWLSSKVKKTETIPSEDYRKSYFCQSNRGPSYERSHITSVEQPTNELPCEFCNEMWPFELIIEHQSGCRPDLVSYPKPHESSEDQNLAAAAPISTERSHSPVLGAGSLNTREDDNESNWRKVQSRRNKQNRENADLNTEENLPQRQQFSARDKFFFYKSQDIDEVSKLIKSNNISNKKRYPQVRKSPEVSKKQYTQVKKSPEVSKKQYTQVKKSPEVSKKQYTQVKISPELSKKQYSQERKSPEASKRQYPQWRHSLETSDTKPDKEIETSCGVKEDPCKEQFTYKFSFPGYNEESQNDANSSNEVLFGEKNKSSEFLTFQETSVSSRLNPEMPAISIAEYNLNNRGIKSLINDYDKASNEVENVKPRGLCANIQDPDYDTLNTETFRKEFAEFSNNNQKKEDGNETHWNSEVGNVKSWMLSNIQDTDYDSKNAETFGKEFVELNNNNQNKEDGDDTHSNSEETFYDADDGGAKFFDIVADDIFLRSSIPEEIPSNYDFNNLNWGNRQQRENSSFNGNRDLNVGEELEDLNHTDADLNCYFQFLHMNKTQRIQINENKVDNQRKLSSGSAQNCECDKKECCCETASTNQRLSLKACSFKDASCSKICSESQNPESFMEETKTSIQLNSKKKSSRFGGKKDLKDNYLTDDELKWKTWRTTKESDSE